MHRDRDHLTPSPAHARRHGMTLRVEQGKGRKDRYAMLPPLPLERRRAWRCAAHAEGKILPGGWIFPGADPVAPLTTRQLNRAVHAAADAAQIGKRVSGGRRHLPLSWARLA